MAGKTDDLKTKSISTWLIGCLVTAVTIYLVMLIWGAQELAHQGSGLYQGKFFGLNLFELSIRYLPNGKQAAMALAGGTAWYLIGAVGLGWLIAKLRIRA